MRDRKNPKPSDCKIGLVFVREQMDDCGSVQSLLSVQETRAPQQLDVLRRIETVAAAGARGMHESQIFPITQHGSGSCRPNGSHPRCGDTICHWQYL